MTATSFQKMAFSPITQNQCDPHVTPQVKFIIADSAAYIKKTLQQDINPMHSRSFSDLLKTHNDKELMQIT